MANTDWGAITPMQKKVWQGRAWKQTRDQSFWFATGMMGSGTEDISKPIHYVKELTATERGDKCVMHLIPDLAGDGVAGDNLLKGKEEAMTASTQEIRLDQLRHAVRSQGQMSEQRTVIRFRVTAKDQLGNWASQKIDELAFLTVSGYAYTNNLDGTLRPGSSELPSLAFAADVTSPSTNRQFFAGTATSTATLTASDKVTWNLIVQVCAYAKRKRIKPLRHSGRETLCMVLSTEGARDLKLDTNYQTNVGRAAQNGQKNPLFTGYFADIDGICLFEHPKVRTTLGAASGSRFGAAGAVHGAQHLMFGAQCMGFARINDMKWEEDADDDYGNRQNLGGGMIIGFKKPVFSSIYDAGANEDFGVISVFSAAGPTV